MKKKSLAIALSFLMCFSFISQTNDVKADSVKVVTIGKDLSDQQKSTMFQYFGVKESQVEVIEVNNAEERQYLEGVATEAQIGKKTYSCAYIEPTKEGSGINVKLANLNWVTAYMIATTLGTAGIYDCNVVAASPMEVSGTGALTGIMKAFEAVTGEELDEDKKEIATEELVVTGNLAEDIGQDQATGMMTDIKNTVIADNVVQAEKIDQVIIDASKTYNVTLTDDQVKQITDVMEKISKQDYDYDRLQSTFQDITSKAQENLGIVVEDVQDSGFWDAVVEFFQGIFDWFKNLFSGSDDNNSDSAEETTDPNLGILNQTNDDLLGDDAVINSTEEKFNVTPSTTPEVTDAPSEDTAAQDNTQEDSAVVATEEPTQTDSANSEDSATN